MTKAEQMFELWRTFGWNVEPLPEMRGPEQWCHGFEGPDPEQYALEFWSAPDPETEPEPEVKVERGTER